MMITMELTHSQRLRRRLALVLPCLASATMDLLDHPRFREVYLDYGFTQHAMVRASVRLLETALGRAREIESADAVAAALVPYFVQHIKEEMHHDEWILQDLELIGVDRARVLARPVSATIAGLVGAQYYWAQHCHPVALLGYLLVIEGNPPTPDLVERLVEQTGHPRQAFQFVEKHAQLDPHHRDDLHTLVDGLPLNAVHLALIGTSALHTVHGVTLVWREISESTPRIEAA